MRERPFVTRLAAVAGVGLAIRLVYALAVMGGRDVRGDGREFHLLANVLATTGSYIQPFQYLGLDHTVPTTEKPPLYPALLALPSALGLDSVDAHRVVSCLLGTAGVVLIGLLGRRVGGDRIGLVAATVAALYPALWMLDASLRSESLYLPLIALVLLLAYEQRPILLGIAIGLAALTRSEALLLLPLLLLFAVPRGKRIPVVLACAATLTPWLARNWITFDQPTSISTNEGGLFAGANCDSAYYTHLIGTWACFPVNDPAWGENEAVISGHLRQRALDYAGDHAGRVPAVVGVRVLRVWDVWDPSDASHLEASIADRHIRAQQAAMLSLYLLVPFAIAGALVLRRRGERLRILLIPIVFVTLVAALSYGSTRFRVAAEPAIVVLASVGMVATWDRLRTRRQAHPDAKATPA
jgi:4-amino-4-deoxy-L-arabinose transferase-like glycosyltransferase